MAFGYSWVLEVGQHPPPEKARDHIRIWLRDWAWTSSVEWSFVINQFNAYFVEKEIRTSLSFNNSEFLFPQIQFKKLIAFYFYVGLHTYWQLWLVFSKWTFLSRRKEALIKFVEPNMSCSSEKLFKIHKNKYWLKVKIGSWYTLTWSMVSENLTPFLSPRSENPPLHHWDSLFANSNSSITPAHCSKLSNTMTFKTSKQINTKVH